uniref:uncharacterized protein LOC122609891 n=1 Tax=Erigeron canadensis TaxID=72917 RepID=UPI001CB90CAE|nr:uncharacterized protein LOC122609891 [Erigeron canadensis]
MAPRPLSIIIVFVISIFTLFVLTYIIESLSPMSEEGSSPFGPLSIPLQSAPPAYAPAPVEAAFYLVYTKRPKDEKVEIYHLHILSSVLGSEEASKADFFHSYYMDCSFSALLTTDQVEELSKRPEVLQIVKLATAPVSFSHF